MLFKDRDLQQAFDRDGFVWLDGFFSAADLTELRSKLDGFEKFTEASREGKNGPINSVEKGLYYTRHFDDLSIEKEMRATMSRVTERALFQPKFDAAGQITSLHGRQVNTVPLQFSKHHRWVPVDLGDEVHTIDPYRLRTISAEEFMRACLKSNQ